MFNRGNPGLGTRLGGGGGHPDALSNIAAENRETGRRQGGQPIRLAAIKGCGASGVNDGMLGDHSTVGEQ
jgi:hypothetical protein